MTDRTPRASRQFRRSRWRPVVDGVMGVFVRAGVVPGTYMLTTTGRKSGRPLTHPATIVREGQRRWLVARTARCRGCTTPARPAG